MVFNLIAKIGVFCLFVDSLKQIDLWTARHDCGVLRSSPSLNEWCDLWATNADI